MIYGHRYITDIFPIRYKAVQFQFNPLIIVRANYTKYIPLIGTNTHTDTLMGRHKAICLPLASQWGHKYNVLVKYHRRIMSTTDKAKKNTHIHLLMYKVRKASAVGLGKVGDTYHTVPFPTTPVLTLPQHLPDPPFPHNKPLRPQVQHKSIIIPAT